MDAHPTWVRIGCGGPIEGILQPLNKVRGSRWIRPRHFGGWHLTGAKLSDNFFPHFAHSAYISKVRALKRQAGRAQTIAVARNAIFLDCGPMLIGEVVSATPAGLWESRSSKRDS